MASAEKNLVQRTENSDFEIFVKYVKSMNKPEHLEKVDEEELFSVYDRIKSKGYNIFDFFYVYNEENEVLTIIPAYSFFYKKIADKIEYLNFEYNADFFDIVVKRKEWQAETRWRVFYNEHAWKRRTNSYWQNKFHFMVRRAGIIDMIKIVFADALENEIGIYYHDDSIYNLINSEEMMDDTASKTLSSNHENHGENGEANYYQKPEQNVDVSVKSFLEAYKENIVVKMIIEEGEEVAKKFIELYENYKDVVKEKSQFFQDAIYFYNLRSWDDKDRRHILRSLYSYMKSYYEQKREKAR